MTWIRERLANGPVPSTQMIADAMENGFPKCTLRRAFKVMGDQSKKGGDKWVWCLPGQDDMDDDVLFDQANTPSPDANSAPAESSANSSDEGS